MQQPEEVGNEAGGAEARCFRRTDSSGLLAQVARGSPCSSQGLAKPSMLQPHSAPPGLSPEPHTLSLACLGPALTSHQRRDG